MMSSIIPENTVTESNNNPITLKEPKKSSKQIHETSVKPHAVLARPNILLTLFLAVEVAYFLSLMIDANMVIRTVLAFPAAYIFCRNDIGSRPIRDRRFH